MAGKFRIFAIKTLLKMVGKVQHLQSNKKVNKQSLVYGWMDGWMEG